MVRPTPRRWEAKRARRRSPPSWEPRSSASRPITLLSPRRRAWRRRSGSRPIRGSGTISRWRPRKSRLLRSRSPQDGWKSSPPRSSFRGVAVSSSVKPMSASLLAQLLEVQGYVVLDGGLATELERRGADLADPLWSARQLVEGPDLIREVHQAYFTAGADIAVSASYQASIAGFAARGIGFQDAVQLMALSVELAKEARERYWHDPARRAEGRAWPLVAASIGAYGASLADGSEYRGNYTISRQELADFHGSRLAAVMTARPDLLAIETIPSAEEAALVLELLAPWPEIRAWVSFTCRDSSRISDGRPVADAIRSVEDHPLVAAVGFNCVAPSLAEELLAGAARVTSKIGR